MALVKKSRASNASAAFSFFGGSSRLPASDLGDGVRCLVLDFLTAHELMGFSFVSRSARALMKKQLSYRTNLVFPNAQPSSLRLLPAAELLCCHERLALLSLPHPHAKGRVLSSALQLIKNNAATFETFDVVNELFSGSVRRCEASPAILSALQQCPLLRSLRLIEADGVEAEEVVETIKELMERPLRSLYLYGDWPLVDTDLRLVPTSLTELEIHCFPIGSEMLAHIATFHTDLAVLHVNLTDVVDFRPLQRLTALTSLELRPFPLYRIHDHDHKAFRRVAVAHFLRARGHDYPYEAPLELPSTNRYANVVPCQVVELKLPVLKSLWLSADMCECISVTSPSLVDATVSSNEMNLAFEHLRASRRLEKISFRLKDQKGFVDTEFFDQLSHQWSHLRDLTMESLTPPMITSLRRHCRQLESLTALLASSCIEALLPLFTLPRLRVVVVERFWESKMEEDVAPVLCQEPRDYTAHGFNERIRKLLDRATASGPSDEQVIDKWMTVYERQRAKHAEECAEDKAEEKAEAKSQPIQNQSPIQLPPPPFSFARPIANRTLTYLELPQCPQGLLDALCLPALRHLVVEKKIDDANEGETLYLDALAIGSVRSLESLAMVQHCGFRQPGLVMQFLRRSSATSSSASASSASSSTSAVSVASSASSSSSPAPSSSSSASAAASSRSPWSLFTKLTQLRNIALDCDMLRHLPNLRHFEYLLSNPDELDEIFHSARTSKLQTIELIFSTRHYEDSLPSDDCLDAILPKLMRPSVRPPQLRTITLGDYGLSEAGLEALNHGPEALNADDCYTIDVTRITE